MKQQNVHPYKPVGATPPLTDRHQPHPRATPGNAASHPAEIRNADLHRQRPKKMRER